MSTDFANTVVFVTSIVNAASVLVLVVITAWYARTTARMLKAVERQAAAAEESVGALKQQLEHQAGLGKTIIASAITSTLRNIEYWEKANIQNLAQLHALPMSIHLVPDNAQAAIEHARMLSPDGAAELSSAFDYMRHARMEIETLRGGKDSFGGSQYQRYTERALEYLKLAKVDLDAAGRYFLETIHNSKDP